MSFTLSGLTKILSLAQTTYYHGKNTFLQKMNRLQLMNKILSSQVISTAPNSNVETCIVTSHTDYPNALLAIKSLFYFLDFSLSVMVIDDGSLEKNDIKQIQHHVKGVKIIDDLLVKKTAKHIFNSNSEIYRNINIPYIRKKIAPYLFSTKDKIMYLDSDVLFFKKPTEIIKWIRGEYDCFYIQDFQDAYFLSNIEAMHLFKKKLWPKVNSGLLGIRRSALNMKLLEKLIPLQVSLSCYRPLQYQVYFALLFSMQSKNNSIRSLPKSYLVSANAKDYQPDKLIAGHYIRLVREKIFTDAIYVVNKIQSS